MYFRETGRPQAGFVSSGTGGVSNGLIVSGSADKSIVICDILVESGTGSLGTAADGTGTLIAYFVSGSINLTSPIRVPSGSSIYADGSSKITITYYLEDVPPHA
jgi:hypothetical protein